MCGSEWGSAAPKRSSADHKHDDDNDHRVIAVAPAYSRDAFAATEGPPTHSHETRSLRYTSLSTHYIDRKLSGVLHRTSIER